MVILGSDYKNYYEIGDSFDVEYLGCMFTYKVIGILQENMSITLQDEVVFLDRYVVAPSVIVPDAPETEDELFYQAASYMKKIHGSVVVSEEFGLPEFTNTLESLKNTYRMFDFIIINVSSLKTTFFQLSCYAGKNVLLLFLGIIVLMMTILNICFVLTVISHMSYFYGVQLLCGCKTRNLILKSVLYQNIDLLMRRD
jgi:hypothetical protein